MLREPLLTYKESLEERFGLSVRIVSNLYAPDALGGAALFSDMAGTWRAERIDLQVTTTFSYYPRWKLLPEDEGCWRREEVVNGVPVERVRMFVPRRPSGLTRLLSDASFLVSLVLGHRGWDRPPDAVLTACPMLSQCMAVRLMWGRDVPTVLIVQDFVVDAALELGILRIPGLEAVLRLVEKTALQAGTVVVTISEPMQQKLRGLLGRTRPTLVVPNWIHGSLAATAARLRAEHRERAADRLFYSGNLGVKQGLPDFIEDFRHAAGDWQLCINGGGAEAERLQKVCEGESRIAIGGLLEEVEYLRRMLEATACVITQRPGVGANFLPSKVLPALATGTPVLAVCDAHSPLGREVVEGGFGAVVRPGDREGLARVLVSWQADASLREALSVRALAWSERYSQQRILGRYRALLEGLATWGRGSVI